MMSFYEEIALLAHQIWEAQGRPDSCAANHWRHAEREVTARLAYYIWLAEGKPEGCAERHWDKAEQRVSTDVIAQRFFDTEGWWPVTERDWTRARSLMVD
jgi:hypothetical protein